MVATKAFFPPMESDDPTGATSFPAQQMTSEQATLAFAADSIPGSKVNLASDLVAADVAPVAAPTIVGTPTIPVELEVVVAAGATADVGTFTLPWKARLTGIRGFKTAANGGAGDLFEVEDTAGGAGANIATVDLNAVDNSPLLPTAFVDAGIDLAAGAILHFRRVQATNAACIAYLTFHKHS